MHKKSHILSLVILVFLAFSVQSKAQWEVRPDLQWKVLHAAHFDVIYNAEQQELASLYAEKLEKAYFQLRPFFSEAPKRISVIINDKTDLTNGYATRIPYPHIMAYPVLPGPQESLADTGDWAFELLAHEYTHILNMEPAGGAMKPLRSVFGTIIAPNLLLPTWWKEGLAVQMETRLGHHGRLRSIYQESAIRAMVEDQSFMTFDLAQVNEVLPSWPEGMRPYLFGSLIWSQMIADHGDKVIDALNQHHGRRVPYFVEEPARQALQKNYSSQYAEALAKVSERALAQLTTLREAPPTPMTVAKNSYQYLSAPVLSPDGKHLAFIAEDDTKSRSIKVLSREDLQQSFLDSKSADTIERFDQNLTAPTQKDEPMAGSIQRASWFPDSKRLIYDKVDLVNRVESLSDLHIYNLETKTTENLGRALRAREPSVSQDGRSVIFVKLTGGKTELAQMKLDSTDHTVEILFSAPLNERISYPTYFNDQEIIFSWRKTDGQENLYRYSLISKKLEIILADFPSARFAQKTPEGLLFTSSKNGTQNLYIADADLKNARPATHSLTAVFMSDMDPARKDLFVTTMTSSGFKIASILKKDWQETPQELPKIAPMLGDRYPDLASDARATTYAKKITALSVNSDYSPYGYLWPQYWIPFAMNSSSDTGLVLQAMTSGFDPLKKHSYSLTGSWDTRLNKGSLNGFYLNQTTSLPFALSAYQRNSYLGDINNTVQDSAVSLAALPDMFWLSRYASLQTGWQYLERSTNSSSLKRTGPFAMLSYANFRQAGAQISPENGLGAYIGIFDFIAKDNYLHHWQYWAGGEKYLSNFLPKHHAIMLRAKGAYTPEDIPSLYGVLTDSLVFIPDNPLPEYIMRGYQRGQFFGRNLINVNAEYRFPVWNMYKGSGTDPFFLRRLSAAVVADGVATDGIFVNTQLNQYESVTMKRSFWSAGIETRLETTLGYLLPVTVVLGVYEAFNAPTGAEAVIGSSFQISGF